MTLKKIALCALAGSFLAACGGGGGGVANGPGDSPGGVPQLDDPAPPSPSINYAALTDRTGTSTLGGAILVAGTSVAGTPGTINHAGQTFTASGISGATSLSQESDFAFANYTFATDIAVGSRSVAIVGVSTEVADMRTTGTAAYTGEFQAQLADASQNGNVVILDWDADIQVNFAGGGDVDLTFTGGGSDLIDAIQVNNATISGGTFSGGTLQTSNNGTVNNITGTNVDLDGTFFGYNDSLQLPGDAGGALTSKDGDTDISGVFMTTATP